ncbi:MAG TPA: ABC transporter ATP-binding protein/permease, partial [Candidatus Ruthenibacterium avium]|nr:ABC transporter ATP-binding protein/permease [Candidatus Ruthenibacterium avium]
SGENVLEHLSFAVKKGQTLGVIGGTGSGKTTLVQLMLRAYEATEGTVLIDGTPVQNYSKSQLGQKFGVALQGPRLFQGTVRSNLQMSAPNADDDTLKKALKMAQCFEFLQEDTALEQPVEQEGRNFSGGQRQRLTVARALARMPEILVLDDASSALDYRTEAALRQALAAQYAGTKVLISQRVASIRHADVILVLEEGRQAGFGTHETLFETCDVYRQICQSQGEEKGEASCGL